ncbi:MAG: PAS domain-containing sensor histidine kinase [Candidatus Sericytochromatia bacterium]
MSQLADFWPDLILAVGSPSFATLWENALRICLPQTRWVVCLYQHPPKRWPCGGELSRLPTWPTACSVINPQDPQWLSLLPDPTPPSSLTAWPFGPPEAPLGMLLLASPDARAFTDPEVGALLKLLCLELAPHVPQVQVSLQEHSLTLPYAWAQLYFELPFLGLAISRPGELHWLHFNDYYCEMLGYTRAEMEQLTWLELTHPDDLEMDVEQVERILKGELDAYRLEKRYLRKGGEVIDVLLDVKCLRHTDGTVACFVAMVQDITARKRYEEQLRQARDIAQEASRVKSAFLANMSHEIRTPLHAIMGFTDLLLQQSTHPVQQSYLQSMQASGRGLLQLLTDLLDLSKMESTHFDLFPVQVELPGLLREIYDTFRLETERKGLQFVIECPPELPVLEVDSLRLRQILLNLVGNAVKFTARGQVTLSASLEETDLLLTVQDTGVGIPQQEWQVIFEPFHRASQSRRERFEGTGLGLPLSYRMAHLLGGSIALASEVGQGSCFTLRVPIRILAPTAASPLLPWPAPRSRFGPPLLPETCHAILTRLGPDWRHVIQSQSFPRIQELALCLLQLADELQQDSLRAYARELEQACQAFDPQALKYLLSELPHLLQISLNSP